MRLTSPSPSNLPRNFPAKSLAQSLCLRLAPPLWRGSAAPGPSPWLGFRWPWDRVTPKMGCKQALGNGKETNNFLTCFLTHFADLLDGSDLHAAEKNNLLWLRWSASVLLFQGLSSSELPAARRKANRKPCGKKQRSSRVRRHMRKPMASICSTDSGAGLLAGIFRQT